MTYFADLMPYSYTNVGEPGLELLCVGWLDASHEYLRGSTSEEFRAALMKLCVETRAAVTRGFHLCNLPPCDQREHRQPLYLKVDGQEVFFGSAEVRVPARDGVGFAAPDLIVHYVVEHGYQPPTQFVEAVLRYASRIPDPQ